MMILPDTKTVNKARKTLQVFKRYDTDFPILYALCLVEIACNEGITVTELASRVKSPLSTTSRAVGALTDARQMGKAFGMVEARQAETERRKKHLYLTQKGHAIIADIVE